MYEFHLNCLEYLECINLVGSNLLKKCAKHYPDLRIVIWNLFWWDWSQNEKLFEIKPPLFWNLMNYLIILLSDGSTTRLCFGFDAPTSATTDWEKPKWPHWSCTRLVWRPTVIYRPTFKSCHRQKSWQRLFALWLQQRWRLVQVRSNLWLILT